MERLREDWLAAIERHKLNPDAPGDDRYWSPKLETGSRDELRAVQADKLPVAVAYMAEYSKVVRKS